MESRVNRRFYKSTPKSRQMLLGLTSQPSMRLRLNDLNSFRTAKCLCKDPLMAGLAAAPTSAARAVLSSDSRTQAPAPLMPLVIPDDSEQLPASLCTMPPPTGKAYAQQSQCLAPMRPSPQTYKHRSKTETAGRISPLWIRSAVGHRPAARLLNSPKPGLPAASSPSTWASARSAS